MPRSHTLWPGASLNLRGLDAYATRADAVALSYFQEALSFRVEPTCGENQNSKTGGKRRCHAIVAREAVDPGFDENEAELRILVRAIALHVLPDRHRLLDKHVEVLRDFRRQAILLQQTQNFGTSDRLNRGDPARIAEDNANLGWC